MVVSTVAPLAVTGHPEKPHYWLQSGTKNPLLVPHKSYHLGFAVADLVGFDPVVDLAGFGLVVGLVGFG